MAVIPSKARKHSQTTKGPKQKNRPSVNKQAKTTKVNQKPKGKKFAIRRKKMPKRRTQTGAVVLSNLPHGFFEEQITSYFRQFGTVTNVRVARSKKTGVSKGYAFIEFSDEGVAEVVADTMNNYLMFNKLMKCKYIPHAKITLGMFGGSDFNELECPGINKSENHLQKVNAARDINAEINRLQRHKEQVEDARKRMAKIGIQYNLEVPPKVKHVLKLYKKAVSKKNAEDEEKKNVCDDDDDKENIQIQTEEDDSDGSSGDDAVLEDEQESTDDNEEPLVMEIDESEEEVSFKTPPNAVKKFLPRRSLENAAARLRTPKSAKKVAMGAIGSAKKTPKSAKKAATNGIGSAKKTPKSAKKIETNGVSSAKETPKRTNEEAIDVNGSVKKTPKIAKKEDTTVLKTPKSAKKVAMGAIGSAKKTPKSAKKIETNGVSSAKETPKRTNEVAIDVNGSVKKTPKIAKKKDTTVLMTPKSAKKVAMGAIGSAKKTPKSAKKLGSNVTPKKLKKNMS